MNSRKFAKAQSNGYSPFKIPPNNNNRALQKQVCEAKKNRDTYYNQIKSEGQMKKFQEP